VEELAVFIAEKGKNRSPRPLEIAKEVQAAARGSFLSISCFNNATSEKTLSKVSAIVSKKYSLALLRALFISSLNLLIAYKLYKNTTIIIKRYDTVHILRIDLPRNRLNILTPPYKNSVSKLKREAEKT
jgi:hypothetical protein